MGLTHLLRARPFRNALLLRGFAAWWAVRIFAIAGGVAQFGNPVVSAILASLAGGVVWFDLRRRNEDLFLGNLGIGGGAVMALGAAPALVGEVALLIAVLVSG